MTEGFNPSEENSSTLGRRLPLVAYGCKMKLLQVERLREAASIVNQAEGRNLFEIEVIDPEGKSENLEPGTVWARIVGEWLVRPICDASELWRTKRELE